MVRDGGKVVVAGDAGVGGVAPHLVVGMAGGIGEGVVAHGGGGGGDPPPKLPARPTKASSAFLFLDP